MRRLPRWSGLISTLLVSAPALADNEPLRQAKLFYGELEFKKCVQRLDGAASKVSTRAELAEIELYGGLCELSLGHLDEGKEHFRLALLLDRSTQMPPHTSPKIRKVFQTVVDALPSPEVP